MCPSQKGRDGDRSRCPRSVQSIPGPWERWTGWGRGNSRRSVRKPGWARGWARGSLGMLAWDGDLRLGSTAVESMLQPRIAAAPQDDHVDLTPRAALFQPTIFSIALLLLIFLSPAVSPGELIGFPRFSWWKDRLVSSMNITCQFAGSRYSRPDATIVRMKIRSAEIERSDTLPFT